MNQLPNELNVGKNIYDSIDNELIDLLDYELLSKLNSIQRQNPYKKYSDIYIGGVAALTKTNRDINPDWMSQSANSFREILFTLRKIEDKALNKVLAHYEKLNFEKEDAKKYKNYLGNLFGFFSDLSHHFSDIKKKQKKDYVIGDNFVISSDSLTFENYAKVIRLYKEYLKVLVVTSIEIHQQIELCITQNQKEIEIIEAFVNNSPDSKQYFYTKATKDWLKWLLDNSFFEPFKMDISSEGLELEVYPELEYLRKMAEIDPEVVTYIIQSIQITKRNCRLIYFFFDIVELLPAEKISQLLDKIYIEKWIPLAHAAQLSGYHFKEIVEKVVSLNNPEATLKLALLMLSVKSSDSFAEKQSLYELTSPFMISHLLDCGIFTALTNLEEKYLDKAVKELSRILDETIRLGEISKKEVYDYSDIFTFYDIDISSLDLDKISNSRRNKKDYLAFVAALKNLIERIVDLNKKLQIEQVYKHIDNLPSSNFSWRLRLFVLARAPDYLQTHLKNGLFIIFEMIDIYDIGSDFEYQNALINCFSYLKNTDQKLYIENLIIHYENKIISNPEKDWLKRTAWELGSCILHDINLDQRESIENLVGMKCNEHYKPKPVFNDIRAGYVSHQSPGDISQLTISELILKLKTDWTPQTLKEMYKQDDFLNPRDSKGLSFAISADVKIRIDEYLESMNEFYSPDIDPQYLSAVLQGIIEMTRKENIINLQQLIILINFFNNIANDKNLLNNPEFQSGSSYIWSQWREISICCSDLLVYSFSKNNIKHKIIIDNEGILKNIFMYLFSFPDYNDKSDVEESPQGLHGIAINTVRGRAFEAFVEYVIAYGFLSEDIKILFYKVLADDKLYMKFLIGRYLPFFFNINEAFVLELLPHIFPTDKEQIFVASFSGYLSQVLYTDVYEHMNEYYSHAIDIKSKDNRKENSLYPSYDELLASHIALAFVFVNLSVKDNLFVSFWNRKNIIRHQKFIEFISECCLNHEKVSEEWLKKKNVNMYKLIDFWDQCLNEVSNEEILAGFGSWINSNQAIIPDNVVIEKIATTLQKTNGKLSWNYNFLKRLPIFAQVNPVKTLEAVTYYLFGKAGKLNSERYKYHYDEEIKKALSVINQNGDSHLKQQTKNLINLLIKEGGHVFWDLKEIIN